MRMRIFDHVFRAFTTGKVNVSKPLNNQGTCIIFVQYDLRSDASRKTYDLPVGLLHRSEIEGQSWRKNKGFYCQNTEGDCGPVFLKMKEALEHFYHGEFGIRERAIEIRSIPIEGAWRTNG